MQPPDYKYLGYGLGLGALFGMFIIVAMFMISGSSPAPVIPPIQLAEEQISPSPTPVPTSTFTSTPTLLPSVTPLPSPTATFTSVELMIASGELAFGGPLTQEQQLKLYEASLSFVAPTYEQSKQMSVLINRARFSDPSSTCGPLSLAILQSAAIIGEEIVPHDFFLINPDLGKDRQIIESVFPNELYENTRYKIKLNKVDWAVQPLFPGDFLYIYMGTEGNFEHMLVVTRVDYQGRAYSVTNFNTDQGFIIDEVLLYDPLDPGAGIFAQWTRREKQLLGSTGFAGFEVWRQKD